MLIREVRNLSGEGLQREAELGDRWWEQIHYDHLQIEQSSNDLF